jgi:hypothetical protein
VIRVTEAEQPLTVATGENQNSLTYIDEPKVQSLKTRLCLKAGKLTALVLSLRNLQL